MKILFIGPNKLSSKHKLLCLKKNFKYVDYIDGYKAFKFNKIYGALPLIAKTLKVIKI